MSFFFLICGIRSARSRWTRSRACTCSSRSGSTGPPCCRSRTSCLQKNYKSKYASNSASFLNSQCVEISSLPMPRSKCRRHIQPPPDRRKLVVLVPSSCEYTVAIFLLLLLLLRIMTWRYSSSPPLNYLRDETNLTRGRKKRVFSFPRAEPLTIGLGPRWAKRKDGGMEGR